MARESSRALPVGFYRDPAELLERLQLNMLGCKACSSSELVLGKMLCKDVRNEQQRGVPAVGHRCKWFKERG